ncbi:MAG: hypothetical protein ABI876_02290, partial [Bacteroidota bacterium]
MGRKKKDQPTLPHSDPETVNTVKVHFLGKSTAPANLSTHIAEGAAGYLWRLILGGKTGTSTLFTPEATTIPFLLEAIATYPVFNFDRDPGLQFIELAEATLSTESLPDPIRKHLEGLVSSLQLRFVDTPPDSWPWTTPEIARQVHVTFSGPPLPIPKRKSRTEAPFGASTWTLIHPDGKQKYFLDVPPQDFAYVFWRITAMYGPLTFPAEHIEYFYNLVERSLKDESLQDIHPFLKQACQVTPDQQAIEEERNALTLTVHPPADVVEVMRKKAADDFTPGMSVYQPLFSQLPDEVQSHHVSPTPRLVYRGIVKIESENESAESTGLRGIAHHWAVYHPTKGWGAPLMFPDGEGVFAAMSAGLLSCDILESAAPNVKALRDVIHALTRAETWPVMFPDGTEYTPTDDVLTYFRCIAEEIEHIHGTLKIDLARLRTSVVSEEYLEEYYQTANPIHYYAFRDAIAKNAFQKAPDSPY